jgi:hypothetical protein
MTTEEAPLTDDALRTATAEEAVQRLRNGIELGTKWRKALMQVIEDKDDEIARLTAEVRRGRDREAQLEDWFDSRLDEIYQVLHFDRLEKAKWREVLEDVLSELDWHIHHYRKSPNDTEVIIAAARRALGGGGK